MVRKVLGVILIVLGVLGLGLEPTPEELEMHWTELYLQHAVFLVTGVMLYAMGDVKYKGGMVSLIGYVLVLFGLFCLVFQIYWSGEEAKELANVGYTLAGVTLSLGAILLWQGHKFHKLRTEHAARKI